MSFDKENKTLNQLIDINQDACDFYKSALAHVQNPRLERSFSDLNRLHGHVVDNLTQRVRENGGTPENDGTLRGKTTRMFGEIMARVSSNVDGRLVSHLEEAEDRCLHSMRDALDSRHMQANTRALLVAELGSLQRSHDYMKALKDSMHVASTSRAA